MEFSNEIKRDRFMKIDLITRITRQDRAYIAEFYSIKVLLSIALKEDDFLLMPILLTSSSKSIMRKSKIFFNRRKVCLETSMSLG